MIEEERPEDQSGEQPGDEVPPEEAPTAPPSQEVPAVEEPAPSAEELSALEEAPAAADPLVVEEQLAPDAPAAPVEQEPGEQPLREEGASPAAEAPPAAESPVAPQTPTGERAKPSIPGADLEVDIVPEGYDPLAREEAVGEYDEDLLEPEPAPEEPPPPAEAQRPKAAIDLASGARYIATGKRKTAVARVILKPGAGDYTINGKGLNHHFPRHTAQRNIRQPLETVGYESRMDVVAKLHGGGISAQAGALRHGIARALIEADPNLRTELKRRGFLTRDSRAKERRKAGLNKALKRPQFSKR